MTNEHSHHRGVRWLPSDPATHRAWLDGLIGDAANLHEPLHPVISRFEAFIESDAEAYMLFHQIRAGLHQGALRRRRGRRGAGARLPDDAAAVQRAPHPRA